MKMMRRQTIKMMMSKVMMKLFHSWFLTVKQTGLELQDLMPLARSPGSPSPPGLSMSPSWKGRSYPPTHPSRGILLQNSLAWPNLPCGNLSFSCKLRRHLQGRKSSLSGLELGRTGTLPGLRREARRGSRPEARDGLLHHEYRAVLPGSHCFLQRILRPSSLPELWNFSTVFILKSENINKILCLY